MCIMVDTGAWYALASSTDRYHQAAKEFYVARIEDSDFVTTTAIVAETWALINARLARLWRSWNSWVAPTSSRSTAISSSTALGRARRDP